MRQMNPGVFMAYRSKARVTTTSLCSGSDHDDMQVRISRTLPRPAPNL